MSDEGRQRRNWHLSRESLLDPEDAPWTRLYTKAMDGDFITFTGFDCAAFNSLFGMFSPVFDEYTLYINNCLAGTAIKKLPPVEKCKGRKRKVEAHSCLGLALSWYRFKGADYILQG
jgi:hypothetical protein